MADASVRPHERAGFAETGGKPRIVVVGAGFGGLECAKGLRRAPADVLLIDRNNHHCFQPLLYQVATAALAANDVAWPIRAIFRRQQNVATVMAEVDAIDIDRKVVLSRGRAFPFDYLVLATGVSHSYFGHDEWSMFAPGLKTVEDALAIRRKLLLSFEQAELAESEGERDRLLTFVVVGGGPTGVELAGAIAEMARQTLANDFRRVDPRRARIILLEAGRRLLSTYPESLSDYTARVLERKGVEVRLETAVTACGPAGVDTPQGFIQSANVIWAAGVAASAATRWMRSPLDRMGRVAVSPDLSLPGRPYVFVIGDAAAVSSGGRPIPGLAPAAKQMGRYVASQLVDRLRGRPASRPFQYRHAGDLATIGRNSAIVKLDRIQLTGFAGWVFWSVAHIYFLIGARNRLAVAFNWLWDYFTFQRGARLILEPHRPEIEAVHLLGEKSAAQGRR